MSTLLTIVDAVTVDPMIIAQSSQGLVDAIREFIGPILLLICGIAMASFLYQRQMTQVIIFIVIAVAVLTVFYVPDILKNLGQTFGSNNSQW